MQTKAIQYNCVLPAFWVLLFSFSPLAINGYVRDTLPGLVMGRHQRVRWHLMNVGGIEDIHSVHFHGQVFTVRMDKEYRQGVYNLYPGKAGKGWLHTPLAANPSLSLNYSSVCHGCFHMVMILYSCCRECRRYLQKQWGIHASVFPAFPLPQLPRKCTPDISATTKKCYRIFINENRLQRNWWSPVWCP